MLLGRVEERAALDRMLVAARDGLSAVLVLRGPAGIGKTALVDYTIERAGDLRVAQVVGIESELELGFAGLHQLLAPFRHRVDRLPAPQRDAVQSAFGLAGGTPPDVFLVWLAVLAAGRCGQGAVAVVRHRRRPLARSGIGAGLGVRRPQTACRFRRDAVDLREPDERSMPWDGLPELRLRGLADSEARELLASVVDGPLDDTVGGRIVTETRRNPLALVEVAVELTPGQLAGESPLSDPLPVSGRLEERFYPRVRNLPKETRTLLLLAAAEPSGDPTLFWLAATRLGSDAAATAPVDALVRFDPTIAFRHPLIRSSVYHAASPGDRRRVHQALAEVIDPELDADRRVWIALPRRRPRTRRSPPNSSARPSERELVAGMRRRPRSWSGPPA